MILQVNKMGNPRQQNTRVPSKSSIPEESSHPSRSNRIDGRNIPSEKNRNGSGAHPRLQSDIQKTNSFWLKCLKHTHLLGQWLNFKLSGSRENKVQTFFFRVHWLSEPNGGPGSQTPIGHTKNGLQSGLFTAKLPRFADGRARVFRAKTAQWAIAT